MKKRIVLIIAIAVMIIAAAGVGVYAFFSRKAAASVINVTQLSVGEKYLAGLNYEKATATLENLIVVEPNNTEAYLALAKAYRYMGDIDTARETLESGLSETDSAVIKRELSEIMFVSISTEDKPAVSEAAAIEIAGQSYQADTKELILRNCGLTDADMAKLSEFTNVERLDISGNEVTDISAIANLVTLKKFYAANNAIADISPLSGLQSLEYVGLRNNRIVNADALFSLENLKYLHLSDNQITAVPNINGGLKLLYLANNNIKDTAAVKNAGLLFYDVSGNAGM